MTNAQNYCPVCDSEDIRIETRSESIDDRNLGRIVIESYTYSVCTVCEQEFVSPKQASINEIAFHDARRSVQNLLSRESLKRIRKKYGLTQAMASKVFGGGANSFSKYERGCVVQSHAMDKLLRVADKFPQSVYFLTVSAGVKTEFQVLPKLIETQTQNRIPKKFQLSPANETKTARLGASGGSGMGLSSCGFEWSTRYKKLGTQQANDNWVNETEAGYG